MRVLLTDALRLFSTNFSVWITKQSHQYEQMSIDQSYSRFLFYVLFVCICAALCCAVVRCDVVWCGRVYCAMLYHDLSQFIYLKYCLTIENIRFLMTSFSSYCYQYFVEFFCFFSPLFIRSTEIKSSESLTFIYFFPLVNFIYTVWISMPCLVLIKNEKKKNNHHISETQTRKNEENKKKTECDYSCSNR